MPAAEGPHALAAKRTASMGRGAVLPVSPEVSSRRDLNREEKSHRDLNREEKSQRDLNREEKERKERRILGVGFPRSRVISHFGPARASGRCRCLIADADSEPQDEVAAQMTAMPQQLYMRYPAGPADGSSLPGTVPKRALAPQGIAGDEKARAQRLAFQVDRGLRNLHFDAAGWLASRTGMTQADKEHAAQALLLALPPQTPPPSGDDALAFVRATLQDPVYQLK